MDNEALFGGECKGVHVICLPIELDRRLEVIRGVNSEMKPAFA